MSEIPGAALLAGLSSIFALVTVVTISNRRVLDPIGAGERRGESRTRRLLGGAGRSPLGRRVPRVRIDTLLVTADAGWSADEVAGAKLLVPVIAFGVSVAVSLPLLALPLGLALWRAPEIVLGKRARRRALDASGEAPLFLDLLAVACSAGIAQQLAVRLAAQPLRGPLATELDAAIERAELGSRWRDEVKAVADRLMLPDLLRAVAVLGRSEALGSSLAEEMARLASDVRASRRSRSTERARTAPVRMLFPLVFLILPAFLLLTVVPVLLSTVRSIG